MLLIAQDEESGIGMSDRQVRDEAVTLFLEGHETTPMALMEVQFILATAAQRFSLRLVPGQLAEKEALVTLRPRRGIRMRLERRAPEPLDLVQGVS